MKLETTLIELSALVEYGSQYLIDRTEMANKNAFDLYNLTSLADFMEYADLDDFDLLDHIDKSTIIEHLSNAYDLEDVFDEYDIAEYVRNNMSIGDIGFAADDIKDYVTDNFDVNDVFDDYEICQYVKDNFDADDMYDEEITEIAQSMVEDMSFNEILDIKGGSEEDILDCLKNSSIIDYVADRFDMDDVYDIDWEHELYSMPKDVINDYINAEYDSKNYLNSLSLEALQEYISSTYDVADFVEWI